MTNSEIAGLYERDLRKLIEEINLFEREENLWKTLGSIRNSSGNLALHIIGGLNRNNSRSYWIRPKPGPGIH